LLQCHCARAECSARATELLVMKQGCEMLLFNWCVFLAKFTSFHSCCTTKFYINILWQFETKVKCVLFWQHKRKILFSISQHTCHAAGKTLLSSFLPVGLAHPVTELALRPPSGDGDGVSLALGYNDSLTLHPSHVLRVCPCQPAAKHRMNQSITQENDYKME